MDDVPSILVGLAGLAALAIVLLAYDWRDAYRQRMPRSRRAHPLRDRWLRHRH